MTITIDQNAANLDSVNAKPRAFPRLRTSLLWIFVFFFLQIVASILALASTILASGRTEELIKNPELLLQDMGLIALPTIWSLVISNLITLGMLMIYLGQKNRLNLIHFNNWSALSFGRTVGLAVAIIAGALALNYLYSAYVIPGVDLQTDLKKLFAAIPDTMFNGILIFAMVALLAPLLEELLFRGLLQNALKNKMPVYAAIAISASIFSLAHVNWFAPTIEFAIFPPIFVLGAAFGLLYHITGSLRVCILLHVINNAAALSEPKISAWLGSY